jgi:translation initiation factor eIF-2B subunit delta
MANDNRLRVEIAERVAAIADDRRHGAAELARQCLDLLSDVAEHIPAADSEGLHDELQRLAATLIASRPSMTSVTHLVSLWLRGCGTARTRSLREQRRIAIRTAHSLVEASRAATSAAASHAAELLGHCRTLVTHSYSSTVYEALSRLQEHMQVTFSESRPLYEGHRLAQALSQGGREATLVTDAQLGAAVQGADAVLVGADSVLTDGSLVNKAGTLLLAAAAAHFEVPVYGCCESHKLRTADMPDLRLERMDPHELGAPEWPGITVQNVYFDVTPPALLSGCILETGLRVFPGYRKVT